MMKNRSKGSRVLCVAALICGLLLTPGCGGADLGPEKPPKATKPVSTEATIQTEPTQPPVETQSAQALAAASLEALRQSMEGTAQIMAIASLGHIDPVQFGEDAAIGDILRARAPQLCRQYPFLLSVPEENVIGSRHGELYCIVPGAQTVHLEIQGATVYDDDYYEYNNTLYESDAAAPILVFCNNSGWDGDTRAYVETADDDWWYWVPSLDNGGFVPELHNPEGESLILDFSAYDEFLTTNYFDMLGSGWEIPTEEDLVSNTWYWSGTVRGQRYVQNMVTFHEDTLQVRWNDGLEDAFHEYPDAAWELTYDEGFAVLTMDFREFAGVLRYNLLIHKASGTLYTAQDMSGGQLTPGWDSLYCHMEYMPAFVQEPMEARGRWERFRTEIEGYQEDSEPGSCFIEIAGTSEDDLWISYTDREFPDNNYYDKALHVSQGELYYDCGNPIWVAEVDHVGNFGTTYRLTLLSDGTLLVQNYWIMDGTPMVSYAWYRRAD